MLDSTNRPKGSQRRLARKRLKAQADADRVRRELKPGSGPSGPMPRLRGAAGGSKRSTSSAKSDRSHHSQAGNLSGAQAGAQQMAQSGRVSPDPSGSQLHPQRRRPNLQTPRQSAQRSPLAQPGQANTQSSPAGAHSGTHAGTQLGDRRTAASRQGLLGKRLPGRARKPMSSEARAGQVARRQVSPLVYLCRLLILGVGVGAIAGTVIAISNPAMRNPPVVKQGGDSTAAQQPNLANRVGVPGTLATISSVRMGREMTDLVAKVTPLTRDLTDLVPGVFVIDLDNGNFLSFNGSTAFSSASMIKLPILIAFFQDVDSGKVKLDEMLSIQQSDVAEGSGDMQYSGAGTQFTALDTATNMIIHSDNTATNMIIRRLGGNELINQRFRQWGLQQTLLRKPLPDLEGLNTTSPKELVSLLSLINEGKLISMKSRDRTFDILRRTVTDTLLPSVVAPGSTVAHKTGDIGSLVGDVGVVDLPSGRRYAIAAMVKRPHNDGRAQELIRQIAAVVYEHFGGQPMVLPSPVAAPPAQAAPGQLGSPQPGTVTPGAAGTMPQTAPGVPTTSGMPATGVVSPTAGTAPNPLTAPTPAPAPGAVTPEAPAPASPEAVSPEAVAPSEPTADPENASTQADTEADAGTDAEADGATTW